MLQPRGPDPSLRLLSILSDTQRADGAALVALPEHGALVVGYHEHAHATMTELARSSMELSAAWTSWQQIAKRVLDVTLATLMLIVLAPVFAAIAIAIKLDSPGPVIFRQTRLTKNGRPFNYLKFRGMVADAEARRAEFEALNEAEGPIFKIRNDPRVTRVGRIIRRTSLDELPQLINVLRGEMSLVGPRPPIPSEVAVYAPEAYGRLLVTGGLTGLWQVSGRSELTFEQMVALDLTYISTWSLWLDVRILLRTIAVVVTRQGAY